MRGMPALIRQPPPELGMMPAQSMPAVVAVLPDAAAQPLHFGDKFLVGELVQILVHGP